MEKIKYEYGAMSSLFSLEASNKLTAYATMAVHYNQSANLVVIYSPEESKEDSWTDFTGKISERLDEIFGGENCFDKYIENNLEEIKECYRTIKRII